MTEYKELCALAIKAMERSYSPYSNFRVGAALLSTSGKVYTGCNVENSAYGECICAERTAFVKAVSEGEKEFLAIAIAGGKNGKIERICPPCGACRQVMNEFCQRDFDVLLVKDAFSFERFALSELLPCSFKL